MLQVEQEKQFTHQALLRADTTVRPDVGLASPTQTSCRPSYANQARWTCSCRTASPPPTTTTTIPQPTTPPTSHHPTRKTGWLGESKGGRNLGKEALPSPSIT